MTVNLKYMKGQQIWYNYFDCLDEIASKYTVYTPGEGIVITQNQDNQNNYSSLS